MAYMRCAKMRYGLSPEQYQVMVEQQAGICGLCGKVPPPSKRRSLHIDHDHMTGAVRKLLCHSCNRGLAYIEDSEFLQKALIYLQG